MAAYLAPALVRLREEVNFTHPKRDKSSDGWIGDTAHAARVSDHNPDPSPNGVVRATDTDKDGILTADLLFVATHDPHDRVEYVIWNGYIYSRSNGFRKQVYTGANKHTGHIHVSLRHGKVYENDRRDFGYSDRVLGRLVSNPVGPHDDKKTNEQIALEVIAGSWGNNPERSRRLQAAGYSPSAIQVAVNAKLGTKTATAVRPSIAILAEQVIKGQWGEGAERRRRLIAAGYDADAVQVKVNSLLG